MKGETIMKRFLRKMSALLVAMAMIMAMCMTVSAEGVAPSSADKATIKVTNVEDGATVTAYQIVAPEYNSNGLCGYKCVSPYVISDTVNFIPTPDEITTIAGQVSGNGISLTGNKANGYTASVGAGEYIVIITSTNYIYNPMVVSAAYTDANDKNSLANSYVDASTDWKLNGATVFAKSSMVEINKTVSEPDAEVGKTVSYEITGTIPSYSAEYTNPTYKITDTISNLAYETDTNGNKIEPQVKIGGVIATKGTDYTLEWNTNGFVVTFLNIGYYAGSTNDARSVSITYNAVVLASASTTDPATNTADLEYSNNPNDTAHAEEKITRTYTFDLTDEFTKVDENGSPLAGATFTLYRSDRSEFGTCTTEVVDDQATIHFEDLEAGTYYLKETAAPEGYSLNNTEYTIVIAAEYDENGTLKSHTITIDNLEAGNKVEVPNTTLSELPSTGGIGTYVFTIVGVVLMAAAAGILFIKRRRSAE